MSSDPSATKSESQALNDDEIKAGNLLHSHWHHEHRRTMWHGFMHGKRSHIQLKFSSFLVFIFLLIKVALALANAYTPYSFRLVGMSVSLFMILFIWAGTLSQNKSEKKN